ncbi:MAG: DUF4136 domain-containing protein [Bacteroidota bacterium]
MKIKLLAGLSFLVLLAMGCTKEPVNNLNTEESRIYITNHDSTINFSQYNTFTIADSVIVIDGNNVRSQFTAADQAFVSAVKTRLQQLGYTMVNKSQSPDLGVSVSRIINTSTGIINYNDYWDYYGGYYDPFYWGYSGYGYGNPGWGFSTYQVKEGMLSIDILDLKNAASNNNQIKAIWNGMIRGSGIFDANTAANQVDILFQQSASYLKK